MRNRDMLGKAEGTGTSDIDDQWDIFSSTQ